MQLFHMVIQMLVSLLFLLLVLFGCIRLDVVGNSAVDVLGVMGGSDDGELTVMDVDVEDVGDEDALEWHDKISLYSNLLGRFLPLF